MSFEESIAWRHDEAEGGVVKVPWSGFDLINAFNAWKKTEDAGCVFVVDPNGDVDVVVTGLAWRGQVVQQVFEETTADVGKALRAWLDSRKGERAGRGSGTPGSGRSARAGPGRPGSATTSTPRAPSPQSGR